MSMNFIIISLPGNDGTGSWPRFRNRPDPDTPRPQPWRRFLDVPQVARPHAGLDQGEQAACVYDAVIDKIHMIEDKPIEELEKQAARNISPEELEKLQRAGYFQCIEAPNKSE